MTVDRAWWVHLARVHIDQHDQTPAAVKRYLPAPAPVRVPPAVLLELLGEPAVADLLPLEGT